MSERAVPTAPIDAEIDSITEAATALLRETEVAAFASASREGAPSAAAMHVACDGFVAYIQTFSMFRKHEAIQRDPRVGYAVWHEAGIQNLREVRSLQMTGRASLVVDPEEIEAALRVSYEQFAWLRDHDIYAGFRKAQGAKAQSFFRIDPVEALWHDGRVAMSYRRLLAFDPDSHAIATARPYRG